MAQVSGQAVGRPAATPAIDAPAPDARSVDLQSLLSACVTRLARDTGAARVCAWMRRPDDSLFVGAAAFGSGAATAPSVDDRTGLESLCSHERAFDLGAPEVADGLREIAERHGFEAARALRSGDGRELAILWIGASGEPPDRVRPRTLAALDAAAGRLDEPLAILGATLRLSALDDEVRRLDRLAALGDLLSEVVHEIRNPMVSVKTFLQLLPGRENDPEFTSEFREVVLDEVRRLERLLDSVVEHARPRSTRGDGRGTEVRPCLESVAGLLKHRAMDREVRLELEIDGELPELALAEDSLRQVLINLAMNALQVASQGGNVTLRARAVPGAVEICVDDDGPGVSAELRQKVFEPFFSTRADRPGGLGLAITRRIVDEGGGRIEVVASPGGGARFRVELPSA